MAASAAAATSSEILSGGRAFDDAGFWLVLPSWVPEKILTIAKSNWGERRQDNAEHLHFDDNRNEPCDQNIKTIAMPRKKEREERKKDSVSVSGSVGYKKARRRTRVYGLWFYGLCLLEMTQESRRRKREIGWSEFVSTTRAVSICYSPVQYCRFNFDNSIYRIENLVSGSTLYL